MRYALRLSIILFFFGGTVWFGYATYRDYSMLMLDAVDDEEVESRARAEMETRTQKAFTNAPSEEMETLAVPGLLSEEEELLRGVRANRKVSRHYVRLIGNGVAFAILLVITGFFFAHQAGDILRFDLGRKIQYVDEITSDQERYEKAEYLILKGSHREAVGMLEQIVKNDPVHYEAQLRMAEVLDKELGDYPAAAPAYEAALKLKFHPERWAWTAVRLCNLYSGKLGQSNRALKLMQRVVDEHPQTAAAAKVRKRLDMVNRYQRPGR
jgi:tetratricopeptide (TPR) repeat protein